jgi:Zn-dependent protease with chaperone function
VGAFVTTDIVLAVGVLVVVGLGSFLFLRAYARRVEMRDADEADKVHSIRRASTFVSMLQPVVLIAILLGTGIGSGLGRALEGIGEAAPIVAAVVLVAAYLVLVALSYAAIHHSYARIRGLSLSAGRGAGRALRWMLLVLIPMTLWIVIRTSLPEDTHPLLWIGVWIGFLLLVTGAMPLLVVVLLPGRDAGSELRRRVDDLAGRLGIRIGGVRVLEGRAEKHANALVAGFLPRFRYVFVTDHLLDRFRADELDAVLVHELAHAKQHHLLIKVFAWIGMVFLISLPALLFGGGGGDDGEPGGIATVLVFLFPILIVFGLLMIQGAIGIALEKRADDLAVRETGADATARALDRLAEENAAKRRTGRIWNLLNQHPGIEQRIRRLRRTPEVKAA